jgi:hypothetical protein
MRTQIIKFGVLALIGMISYVGIFAVDNYSGWMASVLTGGETFVEKIVTPNAEYPTDLFEFKLEKDAEKGYAKPGLKSAEMMNVSLEAKNTDLVLDSLKFKIEGVDPMAIERVILVNEDGNYYQGKHSGEYVKFKDIDLHLKMGEKIVYPLKLALSNNLPVGTRIRFMLENGVIYANDVKYPIAESFPVKGAYLTIVNW